MGGTEEDAETKNWGGGKRSEKDLWIGGMVYGRKRTQWQRQRCFGLQKFAADQKKLW